jgi:hypothetical protein
MKNKASYKIDKDSLSYLNKIRCELGKIEGKPPALSETNRRIIKLTVLDEYIKRRLIEDARLFKGGNRR